MSQSLDVKEIGCQRFRISRRSDVTELGCQEDRMISCMSQASNVTSRWYVADVGSHIDSML